MSGYELAIWAVYDRPTDYPNDYVARRFTIRDGEPYATADVIRNPSLSALRQELHARGLYNLSRMAGDEPHIIESWV